MYDDRPLEMPQGTTDAPYLSDELEGRAQRRGNGDGFSTRGLESQNRRNTRFILLVAYALAAAAYFIWRTTVFAPAHPIFSLLFYVAELLGFVYGAMFLVETLHMATHTPPPPPCGLSVDVFVPTYNEPVTVVRRTMVAALRISYPHQTWLLDDGNRAEMRAMAAELGCRYLARANNDDAKAGNLNNALKFARGDIVAVFDADHIADPRFLDRTLGYFGDPRVAFVQTPQEFYNFDSFQHIGGRRAQQAWSEHSLFYHIVQRGRDARNAAMMCGCAVVVRRTALDTVGGFMTGTVTEDMHTSVRIHAAGWRSISHPETLSAGLAPRDARSFARQRRRWAQGAMQVCRKEWQAPLTAQQRLAYGMHVVNHLEGLRHAFFYFMPMIVLGSGLTPFQANLLPWLAFTAPYFSLSILGFEEFARGHGRLFDQEVYNLARCPASLRAFAQLLWARPLRFWVTPKGPPRRSQSIVSWVVLAGTSAAVGVALWRSLHGRSQFPADSLIILMLWAGFAMVTAARLCVLTRRCNHDRRRTQRFPVQIPAILKSTADDAMHQVLITSVSAGGLSLRAAAPTATLPPGRHVVGMTLLGKDLCHDLVLGPVRSNGEHGAQLIWANAAATDNYEYAIHVMRIRTLATLRLVRRRTWLRQLVTAAKRASRQLSAAYAAIFSGELG
jgi:cellulose synthase (UDP-forming)